MWWLVALGMLFLLGSGEKRDAEPVTPDDGPDFDFDEADMPRGPLKPIAVGPKDDPEIAALLQEMADTWAGLGVDLSVITPREFTKLRKTPEQVSAIPPRAAWPTFASMIREVYMPIRQEFGKPIRILNGYRPEDYNRAVGGEEYVPGEKRGSAHMYPYGALDLESVDGADSERQRLALIAAKFHNERGKDLRIGLGVYGLADPSVHVDMGYSFRDWKDADHWKAKARVA